MRCPHIEACFEKLGNEDYNHDNVSPQTPGLVGYNCIAWAAGDRTRRWWPSTSKYYYWPDHLPRHEAGKETLGDFIRAFESLGYQVCDGPGHEPGLEKVAIFTKGKAPKHAARQLESGTWTSKLGDGEDVEHFSVHSIGGDIYGDAVAFLSRPRAVAEQTVTVAAI